MAILHTLCDDGPVITRFEGFYAYLSNFSPSVVEMYGEQFPTCEHAFQAAKWPPVLNDTSRSLINAQMRERVRRAPTPGIAKRLGHTRLPLIRADWDEFRLEAMLVLIRRKFGLVPMTSSTATADAHKRGETLLGTGEQTLVEGNTWGDDFWGAIWQGRAGVPSDATVWATEAHGDLALVGQNELGRTLMKVRGERQALIG